MDIELFIVFFYYSFNVYEIIKDYPFSISDPGIILFIFLIFLWIMVF